MADSLKEFFAGLSMRPFHRVITQELLDQLPDSELDITIYDIVWAVKKKSWEERLEFLDSMSVGYQATYSTITLEGEVSNGGFNQFFYNPTWKLFMRAVSGYRRFGLDEIACLAESACAQYVREAKTEEKTQLLSAGRIEDFCQSYGVSSLGTLDQQMWAAKFKIAQARVAYIRRNSSQFLGDFRHLYPPM